jgi:RNA-directed DNA polymerase
MPEDAPGNPGAGRAAQSAGLARLCTVREMQAKLHRWAGEDPSRRFGDLFNLVYDPDFLAEAWFRVKANAGSRTPGIDGATVASIENRPGGVGVFLEDIRAALKCGDFCPVPVRQVMIPKKSGKLRKLGIATVADRVVQAALKLVLEPIFEADFQPCSYGFRPSRRAQDAIAEIQFYATHGYEWVLEADIRACFDEIGHVPLMDRLRARIKDKRVCALVKAFLKAGVMTADGEQEESYTGTPQGGLCAAAHNPPLGYSSDRTIPGQRFARAGPPVGVRCSADGRAGPAARVASPWAAGGRSGPGSAPDRGPRRVRARGRRPGLCCEIGAG